MTSERTPEQIIGHDAYMQLVFEGYAVIRAVPDVPELVRYKYSATRKGMRKLEPDISGTYVLYSQAAAVIAAKDAELNKLNVYNNSYHNQILELRELLQAAEAKLAQMEKQEAVGYVWTICGALKQFSFEKPDVTQLKSGLIVTPLYAAPVPAPDLKAENERLREKYQEAVRNAFKDVKPALNSEKQP